MRVGNIIANPMDGLIGYHLDKWKYG